MRAHSMRAAAALAALVAFAWLATHDACAGAKRPASRPKKLIEWGWDERDTRYLRDHGTELGNSPFDGLVFHIMYRGANGADSNFTWAMWGRRAFTHEDLAGAFADLNAVPRGVLANSFLRVNVTPADIGWFDDPAPVVANYRLAAELAKAGGCAGIWFDDEPYVGRKLYWYDKQDDRNAHPWPEYANRVRLWGRQIMAAMQQGYPDLTVIMTYGYCLPWHESTAGQGPLERCANGMIAPFMDGMFAAATGNSRIVDGYELSYAYRDTTKFRPAYVKVKHGALPIVADSVTYARYGSIAFGIWLDNDWRRNGWRVDHPDSNFYTPEAFSRTLSKALETTDEYVWIYSERPGWFHPDLKQRLPNAYAEVVKTAHGKARSLKARN